MCGRQAADLVVLNGVEERLVAHRAVTLQDLKQQQAPAEALSCLLVTVM